jgi:hypothetical protein
MTKIFKALCGTAIALALVSPAVAQKKDKSAPAPAAAVAGPVVPGIGVANLNAAVAGSNAFQVAGQQRQTTYKATYDSAQARATQIAAELKGLIDKFNADKAAKKPEAVLQQSVVAYQQRQERAKEEIRQIMMPVLMSEAYVEEQITDKLDQAVQAAWHGPGPRHRWPCTWSGAAGRPPGTHSNRQRQRSGWQRRCQPQPGQSLPLPEPARSCRSSSAQRPEKPARGPWQCRKGP